MEYKKYKLDNYNIYTIKTDKFKNCHIEVLFRKKVIKEDLTKDAMICEILMRSSKKYPTRSELTIEFENLYNTSIYGVVSKVGSSLFTNYCLDFLHPKYTEKGMDEKAIELLFEMILNPNINNNAFEVDNFNIVKNNLKSDILAAKENVYGYAIKNMLTILDPTSPSSYSVNGYVEDLDDITPENLYEYYKDYLKNSVCDVFVIGNLDMDHIVKIIKNSFKNSPKNTKNIELFAKNKSTKKIKNITEKDNYTQGHLVLGYNIENLNKREMDIIFPVYNVILGAGSLENKLAKYLREQNSLCYTTNSIYQKYDKLLIIYAGIDEVNYPLAVKLIKKCVDEMNKGIISDEELEAAKLLILSSLEMVKDNGRTLINNYIFKAVADLPDIDDRIKEIKKVTKKDIENVAGKVKLNTIYLLAPGGEE